MNEIHRSKKIQLFLERYDSGAGAGLDGTLDEPCKGGTTAQGLVIVVELGLLFRGGRGECRSYGAHFTFICRYPGFHIGLCPHSTLGYAGVSCLKALVISLNADNNTASVAQCNSIEF